MTFHVSHALRALLTLCAISFAACDGGADSGPTGSGNLTTSELALPGGGGGGGGGKPSYQCKGKNAIVCDDSNPCTADTCDKRLGCIYTPVANACEDGNDCTWQDTCQAGVCVGTNVPDGSACDDADFCTLNETCTAGACGGGEVNTCDDLVDCTTDSCQPESGCLNEPDHTYCADADPCTADICDPFEGCLVTTSHDVCETGGPLSPECNSCVAAICAADPYCCNTMWDSICVDEVAEYCDPGCPPT